MYHCFYVQDSRGYLGNTIVWWAKGGNRYTTDLSEAAVYTQEEAQDIHNTRKTDIPWPKEYIDIKSRPTVDIQDIQDIALLDIGIIL